MEFTGNYKKACDMLQALADLMHQVPDGEAREYMMDVVQMMAVAVGNTAPEWWDGGDF